MSGLYIDVAKLHVKQQPDGTVMIIGCDEKGKTLWALEAAPLLVIDSRLPQATASIRLMDITPSDPDSNIL